jgi:hypothetical protein
MPDITKIRKEMPVLASDEVHIGTVANILGVEIVLCEPAWPRTIPLGWVLSVDTAVHLAKSSDELRQRAL